jgi:hypothetical protein
MRIETGQVLLRLMLDFVVAKKTPWMRTRGEASNDCSAKSEFTVGPTKLDKTDAGTGLLRSYRREKDRIDWFFQSVGAEMKLLRNP